MCPCQSAGAIISLISEGLDYAEDLHPDISHLLREEEQ